MKYTLFLIDDQFFAQIDNRETRLTRSDLLGAVDALVHKKIMQESVFKRDYKLENSR